MKPYIQAVDREGNVTFMHEEDGPNCDHQFVGLAPGLFKVVIADRNGSKKDFTFSPVALGEIVSRTISPDTACLVEKTSHSYKLHELVEAEEIYSSRVDMDHRLTGFLVSGVYDHKSGYFFRLRECVDGMWCLGFVFYLGREVLSYPVDWEDFSR